VRKGTQAFVSILSLGLVAAGYQAGLAAEISNGFSTAPVSTNAAGSGSGSSAGSSAGSTAASTPTAGTTSAGSETLNTPAPAASESATGSTATGSNSSTNSSAASTPKAAVSAPASSSASTPKATTAAPAPVSTPKATTAAPAAGGGTTKTGTAINYRYGTVQVSVTKASGKITAVNLLQEGATGGRQGAFSYLVDYAIQANGSSFGNLGGATFTTDAFKQSLESALAKF
jgi:uncharacterized protein with FMN-binding domain